MTLRISLDKLAESETSPLLSCAARWKRVELGKIAIVQGGYPFLSRYFNDIEGVPVIRIRDLGPRDNITLYSGPIPSGYWVEPGDLLVGMDGDFRTYRWDRERALLNQRVSKIVANPAVYSSDFLELILPAYLKALQDNTSSVTVRHLSIRSIQELPVPFPSLDEQRRIVQKLREFADVWQKVADDLDETLDLCSAFLNATIRRAYTPGPGWSSRSLAEIGEIKSGLTLGRRYAPDEQLVERPYLRVANVQRGRLNLDDVRSVRLRASEAEKLYLQRGDILMNEGGDRDKLGRGWLWEEQIPNCIHQNHVFRLRLIDENVTPAYVARYTNYVGHEYFYSVGTQTSNLASISARNIGAMRIPVPPKGIAAIIDEELNRADQFASDVRREVSQARELIESLRSALLATALRGELTEQGKDAFAEVPDRYCRPEDEWVAGVTNAVTERVKMSEAIRKRPLADAIGNNGYAVTPEQLFTSAGYVADEVEEFYKDLSAAVDNKILAQTDDWKLVVVTNLEKLTS
ncbi:restriction endonuclease subunit S [Azospirillum sp. sgz302134]